MITLKTLKWDNLFSYGKGNVIEFDKYPIIQLIGKNGHGKSSIALVLEECLFNKNSKGIKKADILNRYVKDKSYSIELSFDKDGDEYVIKTTRGSTQTVSLYKNGVLYKTGNDINSSAYQITMGTLVHLNGTTDYIEIYGYVASSTALNATSSTTWFNGCLLLGG